MSERLLAIIYADKVSHDTKMVEFASVFWYNDKEVDYEISELVYGHWWH